MITEEFNKCKKDFEYFLRTYFWMRDKYHAYNIIRPYPYQTQITTLIKSQKETLINTAREMGITTVLSAYTLWLMTFFEGKVITSVSVSRLSAKDIFVPFLKAYNRLHKDIKPVMVEDSGWRIEFENGSYLIAESSTTEAVPADLVILDNASFIPNLKECQDDYRRNLKHKGHLTTISTLYTEGEFLRQVIDAKDGVSKVVYLEINHNANVKKGKAWKEKKEKKLGKDESKLYTSPNFYYTKDKEIRHLDGWAE
jgi:hypothetical protein